MLKLMGIYSFNEIELIAQKRFDTDRVSMNKTCLNGKI